MTQPIVFDLAAAQRIANAVRKVEIGDRAESPLRFRRIIEDPKRIFRIATFTGSWSIDTEKTVTFKYRTNTPNTAVATNLFVDLEDKDEEQTVAIAREGTAWYLIEYEQPDPEAFRIATFTGDWGKYASKTVAWKYSTATPNTAEALNLFVDFPDRDGLPYDCAVAKDGEDWFLVAWEWHTATASQVTVKEEVVLKNVVAELDTNCDIVITPTFATLSVVSTTYQIEIVKFGRPDPEA